MAEKRLRGTVMCDSCDWEKEGVEVAAYEKEKCPKCGTPLLNWLDMALIRRWSIGIGVVFKKGDKDVPKNTIGVTINTSRREKK
jgi:Zn-finger nucleic acid-binding protein